MFYVVFSCFVACCVLRFACCVLLMGDVGVVLVMLVLALSLSLSLVQEKQTLAFLTEEKK